MLVSVCVFLKDPGLRRVVELSFLDYGGIVDDCGLKLLKCLIFLSQKL